jgi:DNA polymerase elongation subunit (family B)
MCRCCKGVSNIHERVANHDFLEQLTEFYGLTPKHLKNRKLKNTKKSIFARIEYQIAQLRDMAEAHKEFLVFEQELSELLALPYDEEQTPSKFESILHSIDVIKQDDILEHYRSIANG